MCRILPKQIFLIFLVLNLICWTIIPCFGRSGKPPVQSCASCHIGGVGSGSVRITGLPEKYQVNQTYNIGVSISHNGQKRWGFLLQARDRSGRSVGTFSSIDKNITICI